MDFAKERLAGKNVCPWCGKEGSTEPYNYYICWDKPLEHSQAMICHACHCWWAESNELVVVSIEFLSTKMP